MASHLDLGSEVGDKETGDHHGGCGVGGIGRLDRGKNIEHKCCRQANASSPHDLLSMKH